MQLEYAGTIIQIVSIMVSTQWVCNLIVEPKHGVQVNVLVIGSLLHQPLVVSHSCSQLR